MSIGVLHIQVQILSHKLMEHVQRRGFSSNGARPCLKSRTTNDSLVVPLVDNSTLHCASVMAVLFIQQAHQITIS